MPNGNEMAGQLRESSGEGASLARIANLLALLVTQGKPQPEQIEILTNAGHTPAEIAKLVGTTANTVSVTLYQLKKNKSKSPRRK